jgi:AraC family transcriptional regulator
MSANLLPAGQFYGTPNSDIQQNELLLSERYYSPNTRLPRHSHEAPFFCLLLKGNYQESYYRKTMSYEPCSIVFHPAGESHQTEMGKAGGSVFLIEVGPRWARLLSDFANEPGTQFGRAGSPLSWLAQQMHREVSDQHPSALLVEGFLTEILGRTSKSEEERFAPPWLWRLMDVLHERYRLSFTILDLAKEMGIHPFHLSRVFRFFNGISIGDYVNRLRISVAREVLRSSHPVALCELAIDLGFADQSHFTRTFKKFTGTSPSRFRSEFRTNQIQLFYTT